MCKVSIIVPVYNVEKYLRECINSLIMQTLRDIEIICINDGSTDNSENILMEYAAKDRRIKIINKVNTGYGNSMNLGLKLASGEYIGIVESDDFADLNMFELLYNSARKYNAEVVKSNYIEESMKASKYKEPLKGYPYGIKISPKNEYKDIFHCMPCIWSALYKKNFLTKNNIWFNETPGASYQDYSFNFKVLSSTDELVLVNHAFLHYRVDNTNSSEHASNKIHCIYDEFEEIYQFMDKRDELIKLRPLVEYMKYHHCLLNYKRLASCYTIEFLNRMAKEFKVANEIGILEKTYWNTSEWAELQDLLYNEKEYIYRKIIEKEKRYIYQKDLLEKIMSADNVFIYGAGKIGSAVAVYLSKHNVTIKNFVVSDMTGNRSEINGINVFTLNELKINKENDIIVLSLRECDQYGIICKLQRLGIKRVIIITQEICDLLI